MYEKIKVVMYMSQKKKSDIYNIIGKNIKKYRIRKGLKQTDLADLLHYSFKNISKWENGKSFPTDPSILNKLAEIFEVPVENIIYGQDNAFDIINKKSKTKKLFKKSSKYIVILLFIIISYFGKIYK